MRVRAVSLFSGPGGSTQGMKDAGVEEVIGVEWEETAVATARAAGHTVEHGDVREIDPVAMFTRLIPEELRESVKFLLQGSPPCQGLSMAGKGKGREDLEHLLEAVRALSQATGLASTWEDAQAMIPGLMQALTDMCSDERSPLTFEVLRWIFALSPDYVMLEQVPAALPIWEAIAEVLESWGYSVWAGFVHAEQFGVPQTRKRAKLLASATGKVEAPVPTHSKYHNRTPEKLDEGVLPWVSMAEALGWGEDELVGFPRRYDGRGEVVEIDGEEYRARDLRTAKNPSFVVTEKARSWSRYIETGQQWYDADGNLVKQRRSIEEPATTVTGNAKAWKRYSVEDLGGLPADMDTPAFRAYIENEGDLMLCPTNLRPNAAVRRADQPAPTMAFGHEVPRWVTPEEWEEYRARVKAEVEPRVHNHNGSTKSRNDGIKVQAWEAAVLQSFPRHYPWQGSKTAQFGQIGNAVPPLLQQRLTEHLIGPMGK